MTQHLSKIEKQINQLVKNANSNLQGYRDKMQLAFELFVAHYNTDLNNNSKPLYNIVKNLAQKDKSAFIDYVKQATNISGFKFTKDGATLAFNGDTLAYNNDFIDNNKWYDKDKKAESSPIVYTDESFIKSIKSLIAKLKKDSCQVNNNLQKATILESLIK